MTSLILANQAQNPGLLGNPFVMIFLMIVMFYFLLIRPQKKQRQELEARIASMQKGDKVITIGGMHAIVHHISKETVTLKISEGVFVPYNKSAIATVDKGGKGDKKPEEAPAEEEKKEG
ncbi:MAG: preprotein translocase subunit YajC [Akkermansiaceae bacterium]